MEIMDNGITVQKWVLIVWSKIPEMPSKFLAQFVCPSQKAWDFRKKSSLLVSVVRALHHILGKTVTATVLILGTRG